jgi:YesN/AraC family two-component response regulator
MALNVLIVDDSAVISKIPQRLLRQTDDSFGEIWEAGDGLEALDLMKSQSIGLVLSDVNMPTTDGLQLPAQIR